MFRKLSDLVADETISKAVAEAIDTEINTAMSGLKDERQELILKNKELVKSFDKVSKAKEVLEAKTGDIDKKIEAAKEQGKADTVKILEQEREANKNLTDELAGFEKANVGLRIENKVNALAGTYDIKKDVRDDVIHTLSSMVNIVDDTMKFGADGATLEDGFKSFFEIRNSYLNAKGEPGSGAEGGGGSGGTAKKDMGGSHDERLSAIQNMIDKGK